MKIKHLLVAFCAITALSCSQDSEDTTASATTNNELSTAKLPGGGISTTWTLGRKSRNCFGFGICRREHTVITIDPISVDIDQLRQSQIFYGTVVKTGTANQALVKLDPTSTQYIKEYFQGNNVILEEDTYIDFSDLDAGWASFKVAPGSYPISYDKDDKLYYFTLTGTP